MVTATQVMLEHLAPMGMVTHATATGMAVTEACMAVTVACMAATGLTGDMDTDLLMVDTTVSMDAGMVMATHQQAMVVTVTVACMAATPVPTDDMDTDIQDMVDTAATVTVTRTRRGTPPSCEK